MIEDLQTDSELWDAERQAYMLGRYSTYRLARSLARDISLTCYRYAS